MKHIQKIENKEIKKEIINTTNNILNNKTQFINSKYGTIDHINILLHYRKSENRLIRKNSIEIAKITTYILLMLKQPISKKSCIYELNEDNEIIRHRKHVSCLNRKIEFKTLNKEDLKEIMKYMEELNMTINLNEFEEKWVNNEYSFKQAEDLINNLEEKGLDTKTIDKMVDIINYVKQDTLNIEELPSYNRRYVYTN